MPLPAIGAVVGAVSKLTRALREPWRKALYNLTRRSIGERFDVSKLTNAAIEQLYVSAQDVFEKEGGSRSEILRDLLKTYKDVNTTYNIDAYVKYRNRIANKVNMQYGFELLKRLEKDAIKDIKKLARKSTKSVISQRKASHRQWIINQKNMVHHYIEDAAPYIAGLMLDVLDVMTITEAHFAIERGEGVQGSILVVGSDPGGLKVDVKASAESLGIDLALVYQNTPKNTPEAEEVYRYLTQP